MDWSDVIVAVITLVAALMGATVGGFVTFYAGKRFQMNELHINEMLEISKLLSLFLEMKSEVRTNPSRYPPSLIEINKQAYFLTAITVTEDMHRDYADLQKLIADLSEAFSKGVVNDGGARLGPVENNLIAKMSNQVWYIKNRYKALINTGKLPPRKGDGFFVEKPSS